MKYFKVILNSDRVPLMTLSSVIIVIASCVFAAFTCLYYIMKNFYISITMSFFPESMPCFSDFPAMKLRLSCHETPTFLSPNSSLSNSLIIRRIVISFAFAKYPYTSLRHRRTCPLLYPAHGMLQGDGSFVMSLLQSYFIHNVHSRVFII